MGDIIKGILILIVFVLLAGQVSAYTPEQQTLMDGINLSYQLGIAHDKAIQGQDVTEYNNLVDIYNAWIRQYFGWSADALLKSKIPVHSSLATSPPLTRVAQKQQAPFNASSDLSKSGKQYVLGDIMPGLQRQENYIEAAAADKNLRDFLYGD
ncbi:MAG: hypothetical protein LUQ38_07965 [Methanotrichaceae archaeon]|nr:hypothetical protein [Methanotrichaceae archaeon]